MSRNKLLAGTALLCIAAIIILLLYTFKSQTPETISITPARTSGRVFINTKDSGIDKLEEKTIKKIEKELYGYIYLGGFELYTATIRSGSHYKTIPTERPPHIVIDKLLVDVKPTKNTYQISIINRGSEDLIYISCAPEADQLDKTIKCIDRDS